MYCFYRIYLLFKKKEVKSFYLNDNLKRSGDTVKARLHLSKVTATIAIGNSGTCTGEVRCDNIVKYKH